MPLTKLQFRPGINREITSYSNEGGWYDCDKVRFRFGFPEKIGGWQRLSSTTFLGTCRALHSWVALAGERYLGVGTHLKYYINEGGGYNDITPIRDTTAAGDVSFSAAANTLSAGVDAIQTTIPLTSSTGFPQTGVVKIGSEIITYATVDGNDLSGCVRGAFNTTAATHSTSAAVTCATLIVSDTDHGALENDFVTFSGASGLGDQITADVLNQEYQVVYVLNSNTYYVMAREVATIAAITVAGQLTPVPVFATTGDSGSGGGSVVGAYQINTGLDTTIVGNGWGAGPWSRGTWGSSYALTASGQTLRVWSHDNFGEDLLFNVRDGGLFYWDKSNGTSTRGVALSSLAGANRTPTVAKQVLVSDQSRHVIVFGCDSEADPGTQDPLLIRFSSQESLTDWAATATNSAGELRLGSGSEIVAAEETRQQVLVFTDTSLYALQYLGAPYTFGVQMISENTTVAGPLATVAVDDQVFWMGQAEFYSYTGSVQRLPCTVRDYVFDDMNTNQMEKICAGLNVENGEIWWFYPSSDSNENNRYVIYNYLEQVWYYGTLSRTFWVDRGIDQYPIAAGMDGYLYNHELGFDDGSHSPAAAITAYIRSSPIDIEDGQQLMFLSRVFPDIGFRNSTAPTPEVDVTTRVRNYSSGAFLRTSTITVTPDTEQKQIRLRGRQMSLYVESAGEGVAWRMGSMRYDMQPDGMR